MGHAGAIGLVRAFHAALGRPGVRGLIIEPRDMSNADFGKLLAADYVRMAQVIKASGAKIG
jgi:hypothetical protein